MTAETVQKSSEGKGIWLLLAGLVVVNLLLGFFLAPRHVALEHTPIVQFPNFLAFLGVPGTWLPAHVTFTWLVMAFLVLGSVMATRALKAVPGPLQNIAEVVLEAFFDLLEQMIGKQGRQFLPLVGTVGLFILTSNLLGNLPGFQAPTANWNTTVALALTVFVWYNYAGIRKHGLVGYLKHFCGPIWWLAYPPVISAFNKRLPPWYGAPASVPSRSFTTIGTPRNGPSGSWSLAAASRARSNSGWITALRSWFKASIRAIAASTSSIGCASPLRTRAAWSVASSIARSVTH